jgi:ATP-dependent DNA helicase RecQ
MESGLGFNRNEWGSLRQQVLRRDNFRCVSCAVELRSADADIHHLLPRSMGGTDEVSNLITLCDGCHASHHPTLAGGLARRVMERWASKLAKWIDRDGALGETSGNFGPALRLFGLERFRHGQLAIVLAALSGKSVLVISPTGSGKTLCFQLPAISKPGTALVVSPLKTLMAEQVSDLFKKKIPATFINSDLSREEKETRLGLISRNAIKLLYVAPERFFIRTEAERKQLERCKPSLLIVDEAHCVDQWGQDFRPEYGRLREVRQKLGNPPVLAFTATAGKEMQDRILHSLGISDATVFVRDVDRPNIAFLRRHCDTKNRVREIADMLRLPQLQGEKVMSFVPTKKVGEHLKSALVANGLELPFYHSQLGNSWERQELVKRFLGQSRPIADQIICTNAFGMGLDVPNVRLVIHWQQPASAEDLLQEFGRAGRDRKPAISVIFHGGPDRGEQDLLRFMAEKTVENSQLSGPEKDVLLQQRFRRIDQVATMLRSGACFRQSVRDYFGDAATRPKSSLGERILHWLFETRASETTYGACCDSCDAGIIQRHGALAYVAAIASAAQDRH